MVSTTPDDPASTTSSSPARRVSPRPPATSLAGLIDVLDRVDGPAGGPGRRRLAAHRAAAPAVSARPAGLRAHGFRATATRSVPLRSVQPAPPARRPAGTAGGGLLVEPGSYWDMTRPPVPAAPIEPPSATRLAALIRRAAMWGAGPHGENLTWRTSMAPPAARPQVTNAPREPRAPEPRHPEPREPWLRSLIRRMALWGAGEGGENLAWRPFPAPVPARRLDPPVVLREMPSTPLIQPAATSPAAALVPAGSAPAARRPIGPVLPRAAAAGWVAPIGWVAPVDQLRTSPTGWPAPPTGWPQPPAWPLSRPAARGTPAPSAAPASTASQVPTSSGRTVHPSQTFPAARFPVPSPRERGLARARGDPLSSPSRGSPPRGSPRRRPAAPTPSATVWSPAASLPAPRPAHTAPG